MTYFETMYLDYVNNFVSTLAFAEYYSITTELATMVIEQGKIHHELSLNKFNDLTEEQHKLVEKMYHF